MTKLSHCSIVFEGLSCESTSDRNTLHLKKLGGLGGALSSFIHSFRIQSTLQLIDTAELEPALSPHSLQMVGIINDCTLRWALACFLSVYLSYKCCLAKLLSQSFNLLNPEKRDTSLNIFHCSLSMYPLFPLSPFTLLMLSSVKHTVSFPSPRLFRVALFS